MEVLFENKLIRNKETLKSYWSYMFFQHPFRIMTFCICGVFIVLNILQHLLWWDMDFGWQSTCALLYILYIFIMYNQSMSTSLMRDREQFGTNDLLITTVFTTDTLQCTYAEVLTVTVAFNKIKKVVITKKHVFLFSYANLCYILDKNNFAIGTYGDFIAFLRSKGLKVKGA